MFSRCFLSTDSPFHETTSRSITITDKSPDLFRFILDYLRGYTVFPLVEAAVPPQWLPLHKMYDNLRRDAAYYGLLRFEVECNKWFKHLLNPADRQAVLKLDFAPFVPGQRLLPSHPLTAEMVLDCHLADVPSLRKRFMKPGGKTLSYGPLPWKQIFDQIRDPSDRDGVLQSDGSAIIEVNSIFLKPPHGSNKIVTDDRKTEFAKIHISKAVTQLILDNARPAGLNNHITIRFHSTDTTTILRFSPPDSFPSGPIAKGQFLFSDKLQSDGYTSLRTTVKTEELGTVTQDPQKDKDDTQFPFDADGEVALDVDGEKVNWGTLCEWSRTHTSTTSHRNTFLREVIELQSSIETSENRRHQALFGGNRDRTRAVIVTPPPIYESVDIQAAIYGSAVFVFARTKFDRYLVPQMVSIRGSSSSDYERKRPIWEGDNSRDRYVPRKKARKNKDGDGDDEVEESVVNEE
jgi:hypothetical protein